MGRKKGEWQKENLKENRGRSVKWEKAKD